jgi:hypothetical protein
MEIATSQPHAARARLEPTEPLCPRRTASHPAVVLTTARCPRIARSGIPLPWIVRQLRATVSATIRPA